jgi:hypothetical protein
MIIAIFILYTESADEILWLTNIRASYKDTVESITEKSM